MTRALRTVAAGATLAATLSTPCAAQATSPRLALDGVLPISSTATWVQLEPSTRRRSPLGMAGLSLALPGAGQHALGQNRKWLYAALEVVGWAVFLERRSAGGEYRDRYRDFAWTQGRIQSAPRVDGDFDYYETVSKWSASGGFDVDSGLPGVQPETDPTTYNGSIWVLASQIFIGGAGAVPPSDPRYQSALAYYDDRAYHAAFLWDWSGVPGGREQLGGLIKASDDRFRQATTAVGVVIANHLIAAADAYLSARGRQAPVRLDLVPTMAVPGPSFIAVFSVPVGR